MSNRYANIHTCAISHICWWCSECVGSTRQNNRRQMIIVFYIQLPLYTLRAQTHAHISNPHPLIFIPGDLMQQNNVFFANDANMRASRHTIPLLRIRPKHVTWVHEHRETYSIVCHVMFEFKFDEYLFSVFVFVCCLQRVSELNCRKNKFEKVNKVMRKRYHFIDRNWKRDAEPLKNGKKFAFIFLAAYAQLKSLFVRQSMPLKCILEVANCNCGW